MRSHLGGRRNAKDGKSKKDDIGHAESCPKRGSNPVPLAISTSEKVEVLRLLVPVPVGERARTMDFLGIVAGLLAADGHAAFLHAEFGRVGLRVGGPVAGRRGNRALRHAVAGLHRPEPGRQRLPAADRRAVPPRRRSRPSSTWTIPTARRPATAA